MCERGAALDINDNVKFALQQSSQYLVHNSRLFNQISFISLSEFSFCLWNSFK